MPVKISTSITWIGNQIEVHTRRNAKQIIKSCAKALRLVIYNNLFIG